MSIFSKYLSLVPNIARQFFLISGRSRTFPKFPFHSYDSGSWAGSADFEARRAVRRGASQTASDVGQQIVGRGLSLTPTLTLRPGMPLRVLLTRDLVLEPYATERRR